jgi:hypothetical protein
MRYDRARKNLDSQANFILAAYMPSGARLTEVPMSGRPVLAL